MNMGESKPNGRLSLKVIRAEQQQLSWWQRFLRWIKR